MTCTNGCSQNISFYLHLVESMKFVSTEMQEQEDKSIKVKRFFTSQRKPVPANALHLFEIC